MTKNILKSLLKPKAYPDGTSSVELIQTHVSWIFLTDSHAYKVKKPVDFGFLNFSTIDRRRFYCHEEVKFNQRLSPDIYEGVVELNLAGDEATFEGTGHVIDYAVKMKRLPASGMLNILIDNNSVTVHDISNLAKLISDFHKTAPTSESISSYGTVDRIMSNWKENFEQTADIDHKVLFPEDREVIKNWVCEFTGANAEIFQQRIINGFIRECDGDLHSENICIVDDKIHIFDCIEFSERFRNCDTAADIAFLSMDLDFHRRPDLADLFISRYVQFSNDKSLLPVLNFYKVYRAFVRGKVESFLLNERQILAEEYTIASRKASMYFRLARGYIERTRIPKTLFITCGLTGSGKTFLASQLAFELGIVRYNSDIVRKQSAGVDLLQHCNCGYGEDLYSGNMTDNTYHQLLDYAGSSLKNNSSVVIDATFIKKGYRTLFSEIARRYATSFVILDVSCSERENRIRLHQRTHDRNSVSDGREELLSCQKQLYEPLSEDEGRIIRLNSSKNVFQLMNQIYKELN